MAKERLFPSDAKLNKYNIISDDKIRQSKLLYEGKEVDVYIYKDEFWYNDKLISSEDRLVFYNKKEKTGGTSLSSNSWQFGSLNAKLTFTPRELAEKGLVLWSWQNDPINHTVGIYNLVTGKILEYREPGIGLPTGNGIYKYNVDEWQLLKDAIKYNPEDLVDLPQEIKDSEIWPELMDMAEKGLSEKEAQLRSNEPKKPEEPLVPLKPLEPELPKSKIARFFRVRSNKYKQELQQYQDNLVQYEQDSKEYPDKLKEYKRQVSAYEDKLDKHDNAVADLDQAKKLVYGVIQESKEKEDPTIDK